MQIEFEGPDFVVVVKPAGWLSVPSRAGASDPRPCVGKVLSEQLAAKLWPVHRLDVEVSGLMLFALHAEAHRAANAWFEQQQIQKTYAALVTKLAPGTACGAEYLWESKLHRGKRRAFVSPHGKLARTRARYEGPLGAWHRFTLWPQTGRAHQLRVHLAAAHGPIVGDTLYGAPEGQWPPHEIALRAVCLDLTKCSGRAEFALPPQLAIAGFS